MSFPFFARLTGKTAPPPSAGLLPPRFMFMEVNKRCNLKCTHCDFWLRDDRDRANYLSRDRKREIIAEFAHMSPHGSLVICGGEPMLDLEEYFAMCRDAREHGLRVLSVVNGTRIRDAAMADRMVLEGPHEISVSLNSHDPAIHNETRGVRTAFDKAVKALRLLAEARDRHPEARSRIVVMGLIFRSNYRLVEEFYDFVLNDIGADNLKLNFVQPSFGRGGVVDDFFENEGELDAAELARLIDRCDERFNLGLNPVWKENVAMYFRSLARTRDREKGWASQNGTTDRICNSFDRNLMVDHYGTVRLCFSTGFPGRKLERTGDLEDFWYTAEFIRTRMRKCNQFCGISHSVRAQSSTIEGQAKKDAFEAASGDLVRPRETGKV